MGTRPMDLANKRQNGVRSLMCDGYRRQMVIDVDKYSRRKICLVLADVSTCLQ
jgi:hypothetical protein